MKLPLQPPFAPMEAQALPKIPDEGKWLYEPKWDGFRCLAFKDGADVYLQSRHLKPLSRYFPEVVEHLASLEAERFVLDGELVIARERRLDFEQLQLRLHPAEKRILKLSAEIPAWYIVFDILVDQNGNNYKDVHLEKRRPALEAFAKRYFKGEQLRLSPATRDRDTACEWLDSPGSTLDGVIAKRLDCTYRTGEREGIYKIKNYRSADCVIGGFRREHERKDGPVSTLLLGLYDDQGLLHSVGHLSGLKTEEKQLLEERLPELVGGDGFTGRAPGGPSRWNTSKTGAYEPVLPLLVVEVAYDHYTGGRFRHGTRLMRWRPDKAPEACTFEQLESGEAAMLDLLVDSGRV